MDSHRIKESKAKKHIERKSGKEEGKEVRQPQYSEESVMDVDW